MINTDSKGDDGELWQGTTGKWFWWDTIKAEWIGPFNSDRAARFNHTRKRRGLEEARKIFDISPGITSPDYDQPDTRTFHGTVTRQRLGLDAQEASHARSCVGKEGDRSPAPVQATHTPEEEPTEPTPFQKHDSGKDRWSLLPFDAISEVVKVLMFGANKYEAHNWSKGADWSRYFDATMRHMTAWWMRDPHDPQSRLSHLAHAACCILFLIASELRNLGKDDRP